MCNAFKGKKHSEKTKAIMSEKAKQRISAYNPSTGTMWVTNGSENRKLKKTDAIPEGFRKGRVMANLKTEARESTDAVGPK